MGLFKRRSRHSEIEAEPEVVETPTLPPPPAPIDEHGRRSVDAQRDYLLSLITPLPAFGMYLLDAWGTAVCEDIVGEQNVPSEDLVAVTGFAVRSDDLKQLAAGSSTTLRLREDDRVSKVGSAVQVRAGQPLPEGADAVVAAELGEVQGNVLTISQPVRAGQGVRWLGSEVTAGVPLLRSGERLDARRTGLLALAGIDRVLARPRPRVVVMSVAGADSDPSDADAHLLAAAVKSDDAQVWRVGLEPEGDRELQDAISDQLIRADILVMTGDLSDGAQLPTVLAGMGLCEVADVALRPGGRIGFGLIGEDRVPVVLLPDDPVAAYVEYQCFVRPLLRKLMGVPVVHRAQVQCLAGDDITATEGLTEVLFGVVREAEGDQVVVPLGRSDGPRLADLVRADALILLDERITHVGLGDHVGCWLLAD